MSMVVDASAVGAFLLPDDRDDLSDYAAYCCRTQPIVVPAIWPFELAHLILKAVRRGRIDDATAPIIRLNAGVLYASATVGKPPAIAELVDLGTALNLSAYDASYAELARRMRLPLLTRDGALARAALTLGIVLARP